MHLAACPVRTQSFAPVALYRVSLPFAERLDPLQGRRGFVLSRALSDRRVWVNSRLLAWVLLPDGWQGLVQSGALDSPDIRLNRVREAGERAWAQLGGQGGLWAFGGHLTQLAGVNTPREAGRELVLAPVRCGLARRIADYPFWDAVWLDAPTTLPAHTSSASTT